MVVPVTWFSDGMEPACLSDGFGTETALSLLEQKMRVLFTF